MNHLSNGIRTLSYIDNRHLKFEDVECQEIVNELLHTYGMHIETNQIEVTAQPLDSVIADRQSIKDIFQGILDNAIKYLDPSKDGNITISSQRDLTYTTYMVRDNGRGMNEEELTRVFEAFQRGDDVVNIAGIGMGMPYVRALVRRHRGVIWFESTPNKGSVCYFTIDNGLSIDALQPDDFFDNRD
jgi:light-regulated signal transduction histidine kinase (bacteriophytochrome)